MHVLAEQFVAPAKNPQFTEPLTAYCEQKPAASESEYPEGKGNVVQSTISEQVDPLVYQQ